MTTFKDRKEVKFGHKKGMAHAMTLCLQHYRSQVSVKREPLTDPKELAVSQSSPEDDGDDDDDDDNDDDYDDDDPDDGDDAKVKEDGEEDNEDDLQLSEVY